MIKETRATLHTDQPGSISSILYWLIAILIALLYMQGFFWIDDARIILQVVENMYEGFGPVYTQGDRVQVHTSPLWAYYLLFFRLFTPSYALIIFLASIIPLLVIMAWFRVNYRPYSFLLLLVLFLSNVLFSLWGSGLDNPLTYVFLTLLFHAFSKEKVKLFIFIAALLLANRLDAVFYIAPLSVLFMRKHPFKENLINFVKFGWPFYLHLLFSVLYYGSIFPNTYYAKVASVNISLTERIVTGVKYLLPLVFYSPLDILFITAPFMLFFVFRKRLPENSKPKAILTLVACSSLMLYVFWIGFDHLNPRLLGVPLFLGLLFVIEFIAPTLSQEVEKSGKKILGPAIVSLAILVVIANYSTFLPVKKLKFMQEKDFGKNPEYYHNLSRSPDSYVFSDLQTLASEFRLIKARADEKLTRPKETEHLVSFVAEAGTILEIGSHVHMIDIMGLADPLMSRIRSTQGYYSPGHNYRPIPRGYPETLMTGVNKIVHPEIATYYDRLKNVISGPLLSASRLKDSFYLMTHKLAVDPNDPENAAYFLSQDEYDQIFEEDYGVYKRLNEFDLEFRFYHMNGEKSASFTSGYWNTNDLSAIIEDATLNEQLDVPINKKEGLLTSGPYQALRPGNYSFELDYVSVEDRDKNTGNWNASLLIGEDHIIALESGSLIGTEDKPQQISGTFKVERIQDMAKFNIEIFANGNSNLVIKGIRLTKLN